MSFKRKVKRNASKIKHERYRAIRRKVVLELSKQLPGSATEQKSIAGKLV